MGRVAILLAILLVGPHGGAWAEAVTRSVRATGVAVVRAGDVVRAADEARQAALREAVEQGVGVLISSTTRVSNFAVIEERILSATRGHVRSYAIVERGPREGGIYAVTVDAVVDLGRLHEDLEALQLAADAAGAPRIRCATPNDDEAAGVAIPETAFVEAALCAELALLGDGIDVAVAAATDAIDAAEIRVVGRGQAHTTQAPVPYAGRRVADSGLLTVSASVDVEAGWTDEATPICRLRGEGRAAAVDETGARSRALRQAVAAVGDSLRRALAQDLQRRAFSQRTVELVVDGVNATAVVEDVTRQLTTALAPLEVLRPRRIESGRAVFEVRSARDAFGLARQLSASGLPGRHLEVVQVTANRMRIAVTDAAVSADGGATP